MNNIGKSHQFTQPTRVQTFGVFWLPALILIGCSTFNTSQPSSDVAPLAMAEVANSSRQIAEKPATLPSSATMTLLQALTSKDFRCLTAGSSTGFHCRGKIAVWPQPINIFIPLEYRWTNSLRFALHFHGFNNGRNATQAHFERPDSEESAFNRWISDGAADSLLVAPESTGQCATFESRLKTGADFDSLIAGILNLLGPAHQPAATEVAEIAITAHSGAFMVMGRLGLALKSRSSRFLSKVTGIGLFDATYGRLDQLTHLHQAMQDRKGYFVSIYKNRGQTDRLNRQFARQLSVNATASEDRLGQAGSDPLFISVESTHYGTMAGRRYTRFLQGWRATNSR